MYERGFRILLIDLDDQKSLYDLRRNELKKQETLIDKLSEYYPKDVKFNAEDRLKNMFSVVSMSYEKYLLNVLNLRGEYDVIILDFRGALDHVSIKVLATVNSVIVPVIADTKDISVTRQFFDLLDKLKIKDVVWFLNRSQNTIKDKQVLKNGDKIFPKVDALRYVENNEIVRLSHRPVFFNEHASTIIPCDDKNGSIGRMIQFIVKKVFK